MPRTALLGAVFAVSGAAALIFETLWFQQAALALGSTAWAASLVLSAYMGGMACGNLFAARRGAHFGNTVRAYAGLEAMVALTGVALVFVLPDLGHVLAPAAEPLAGRPGLLNLLRLALAFALLLLPSAALGMTLPLLVQAAAAWERDFGRALGLLYGANTCGAVLGVALTELALLPNFGVRGSALFAGGLDLLAAAAALVLARGARPAAAPAPAAAPQLLVPNRAAVPLLLASLIAGFTLLALEVVWLRFLMLFLNDTPLAFAMVLSLVLSGIALGSVGAALVGGRLAASTNGASSLIAYAAGLLGLAGYLLYPRFLEGAFPPYQPAATILRIAAPLVLPTALASGALFTTIGAELRHAFGSNAAASGSLSFASTVGAGIGPLVAGFALLPGLGMERSLLGLFALYGVAGFLLGRSSRRPRALHYAAAALFVACFAAFPLGAMRDRYVRASAARWTRTGAELVEVREGTTATLLHLVQRRLGAPMFDQLATNAYSMSVNGFFGRRYMQLFVYLPLAIHPKVERALVVGFGVGNTAAALTDSAELRRIDIADISSEMLEQSRRLRTRPHRPPLDDPRVVVHLEDGRFFLQSTSARFDLITGEPPPPIMAGVANLYTTEYFQLVRSRLAEGGIASYWLPVINISAATTRSLIAGFCAAFPDCSLWHGAARNLMLMGTRGLRGSVSEERFTAQWRDPRVRDELQRLGFEQPAQLGALFIGDASYLRELVQDAPPLSDDWPRLMQQPDDRQERDALLAELNQANPARDRFARSPFIAAHWPPALREKALPRFQEQWLIDELLPGGPSPLRDLRVLHQVLRFTSLRLPVLLLLDSDPDLQAALLRLTPAEREHPEWLAQKAAGLLADRDLTGALDVLSRLPPEALLPLPGLREYLGEAVKH